MIHPQPTINLHRAVIPRRHHLSRAWFRLDVELRRDIMMYGPVKQDHHFVFDGPVVVGVGVGVGQGSGNKGLALRICARDVAPESGGCS